MRFPDIKSRISAFHLTLCTYPKLHMKKRKQPLVPGTQSTQRENDFKSVAELFRKDDQTTGGVEVKTTVRWNRPRLKTAKNQGFEDFFCSNSPGGVH